MGCLVATLASTQKINHLSGNKTYVKSGLSGGCVLLQLVYVSSATTALAPNEIAELCAQAGENNRQVEITGLLAVKGSHFIQALEGPKAVVEDTFLRIVVDPRHKDLRLLSRRIITRREFGEWDMACCDDPELLQTFIDRIEPIINDAPAELRKAWREVNPA